MAEVIWAVTHGWCADYDIDAICPTKELAEELAAKWNRLENCTNENRSCWHRVDEYPLVRSVDELVIDDQAPYAGKAKLT